MSNDYTAYIYYNPNLNFRQLAHNTADGRVIPVHAMTIGHMHNAIRQKIKWYASSIGAEDGDKVYAKILGILYKNDPVFAAMQKELAYRRFAQIENHNAVLMREAISDILPAFANNSGCVSGRYASKYPNYVEIERQAHLHHKQSIPKQETIMKHKQLITLLQENYTTVGAEFPTSPGRVYTYKTDIKDLKVGDLAVVKVKEEFNIVKIVRVDKTPQIDVKANYEYKWLIQKVNVEAYDERLKVEDEVLQTLGDIEREQQRSALVDEVLARLPEESPTRKMFLEAVAKLRKL